MFDIKQAMVLQPLESYIKQKLLRPLLAIAADHFGKPEWLKYDLGLKMLPPYSLMSDIDINLILTKDEGRDIIGYPAMKNAALGGTVIGTRVTETEVLPGSQQSSTPANPKGGGAL